MLTDLEVHAAIIGITTVVNQTGWLNASWFAIVDRFSSTAEFNKQVRIVGPAEFSGRVKLNAFGSVELHDCGQYVWPRDRRALAELWLEVVHLFGPDKIWCPPDLSNRLADEVEPDVSEREAQ